MAQLHKGKFGDKIRSDAHGLVAAPEESTSEAGCIIAVAGNLASRMVRAISSAKALQFNQLKKSLWRQHQNIAFEKKGTMRLYSIPWYCRLET